MCAKLLQSNPNLCDPVNCSPPGSSVHGILQARILEWVAVPSSRRSSQPRDGTWVFYVSCIGRQVLYTSTIWEAPFYFIHSSNISSVYIVNPNLSIHPPLLPP